MSDSSVKHFDYLIDHDAELEDALGLSNLTKKINRCRCVGREEPDLPLSECRKILEAALRKLTGTSPAQIDLIELIGRTENTRLFNKKTFDNRSMSHICNEIRRLGNSGVHWTPDAKPAMAKEVLELLDDFLRWCAERLQLIPHYPEGTAYPTDPIFISKTPDETEELIRKAKLASNLSGNKAIEKNAEEAINRANAFDSSTESKLQKIKESLKQVEKIGGSTAEEQNREAHAAQQQLFDSLQTSTKTIESEKKEINARFDDVNKEIDEILNEHDFVNRLLHGDKHATEEQLAIMAFPKGSNSSTNILQIAGGAGTGKTLCLLAKTISEIDDHGQTELFTSPKKKALFVCFNKPLANYVRGILSTYKGFSPDINVINYDRLINQLSRPKPEEDFSPYANDVRYPLGSEILYAKQKKSNKFEIELKFAQGTVAKRYPNQAKEYYLNPSNDEDLSWMIDEIRWIEARFKDEADAISNYPKAERKGRGRKRVPRETARRIILEVWTEFNKLLKENNRYTIEQATKKLLGSNQLPTYDAIAIDEVQDLSLLSVKLLLRFRRSQATKVFISGDENQKIYQRDFTWKELGKDLTGYTITLHENKRNSKAIESFSNRLLGVECSYGEANDGVCVKNADDNWIIERVRELAGVPDQTTALIIGNEKKKWEDDLEKAGIPAAHEQQGTAGNGTIHLIGNFEGKGLEFDNVVVDYSQEVGEDEEEEKRLRYVHFTRARRRLYIRYQGTPPKLLTEYYADFLDRD